MDDGDGDLMMLRGGCKCDDVVRKHVLLNVGCEM